MISLNLKRVKKFFYFIGRESKKKGDQMKFLKNDMKGEDTKIFALGGLGEVGKNMYCFMHKDEIIITDAGITFEIKGISEIMDAMEYPGIRVSMHSYMGKLVTPIKIDISTGDVITPRAIEYHYKLLLEDRTISLWSYNLETILAEKLQTILARGILNTRMRDFYDVYMLLSLYKGKIDSDTLEKAFESTCKKRKTDILKVQGESILDNIATSEELRNLWKA